MLPAGRRHTHAPHLSLFVSSSRIPSTPDGRSCSAVRVSPPVHGCQHQHPILLFVTHRCAGLPVSTACKHDKRPTTCLSTCGRRPPLLKALRLEVRPVCLPSWRQTGLHSGQHEQLVVKYLNAKRLAFDSRYSAADRCPLAHASIRGVRPAEGTHQ